MKLTYKRCGGCDENRGVVHELKTWAEYFDAVVDGRKTFEIRFNDRNFAVGDILHLVRVHDDPPHDKTRPPQSVRKKITYIVSDRFGLEEGWVCLGLGDM